MFKDDMSNRIEDQSGDRQYFVITPHLVFALCDVYERSLWSTIKMIAGEDGTCKISTPDLADFAAMSAGKVSQCRKVLSEMGLLHSEMIKDPNYPQPVYNLKIPDLWERNIAWAIEHPTLIERLDFMRASNSFHLAKARRREAKLSSREPSELSSHEKGLSPDEKGLSPDEKGLSPDETNKNIYKNNIEQYKNNNNNGRSRSSDPAYDAICSDLENNYFGSLSPMMIDLVNGLMDLYPSNWIQDAITISVKKGKRNLSYVEGILKNMQSDSMDGGKTHANTSRSNPNKRASAKRESPNEHYNRLSQ